MTVPPGDHVASPRDRLLTVYGRKPVLEALADETLAIDKVVLATTATGPQVDALVGAARRRGVEVRRVAPAQVTRISRNGRQDQGVAADVVAPHLATLDDRLATLDGPAAMVLLDGITNPQNVGMIVRTAAGAGLDGIVVPRAGVAEIGPLVVKASAGVVFSAPILRAPDAAAAAASLRAAGFRLYGLAAAADRLLFDPRPFAERAAFVLGAESTGLTVDVDERVAIPMAGTVESLNVAVAAGVVCFELVRRALA